MLSLSQPGNARFFAWMLLLMTVLAAAQQRMPAVLAIRGVEPDLVLMAAVAAGLLGGRTVGACAGFWGAYLLASSSPFSPGSIYLSHVVLGFAAGFLPARLYTDNPIVPAGAGCLAGLLSETLFYLLNPRSPILWLEGAGVQAVFCMLLTPLLYAVLQFFMKKQQKAIEP